MFDVIVKHAPKYLSGSLIASGTALVMTKYYTAVFSPTQFGILALYLVMFKYVMTFVSLNLDSSSTRFYFDYRNTKKDEYLNTIFWLITFIAFIVLLAGLILMDFVSNWILPGSQLVYLMTLFAGIAGVYVSFLTRILYNEQKSSSVLKHTVFQTFINHVSSVLFISIFDLGILGRMGGQGLGYILNTVSLLKEFSRTNLFKLQLTFNQAMAKETFLLTIPSMIAAVQGIAFIYLDRFFLKHYIGDTAVGIYTLGFLLGQGLSVIYESISQAILPKLYNNMNDDYEKTKSELEHFSYRYYLGLLAITIALSALSPIIVSLFSNDNYEKAAHVIPYILAGFMMGGFYKIPSLVLGFHKKVWLYPFLALLTFIVNALLNWWLIPIYGMIGAAFASFTGVFIYSSVLQYISKKYMSKQYNLFVFTTYLMVFMVCLGAFYG